MNSLEPRDFVTRCGATAVDRLFTRARYETDFVFSEEVTNVFPNMIGRSVPGYWENVDWIGQLAQCFIESNETVYDLGCSLGAVSWSIDRNLKHPATLIAVDNSKAMMGRLSENLSGLTTNADWRLTTADITALNYQPCAVVTMHYCLQFVPIAKRSALLNKLVTALKPGGALFLSEKVRDASKANHAWLRAVHHDFKQRQGYSDEEIAGKADSIATMMPLETIEVHEERLREVGFSQVIQWRRSLNFNSWVAIK